MSTPTSPHKSSSSPSISITANSESITAKTDAKFKFTLQSTTHSLATIPLNSYLVHATNCFATWGAGVALAIHDLFPNADKVYSAHCDSFRPTEREWPSKEGLLGGVCLVPPQRGDHGVQNVEDEDGDGRGEKARSEVEIKRGHVEGVWIGCLFTSYGYGRPTKRKAGLDKKSDVLEQTKTSLRAFRELVERTERGEAKVVEEDGMRVLKVTQQLSNAKKRKRNDDDEVEKAGEDGEKGEEKVEDGETVKASHMEAEGKGMKMDIYSPQFNSGAFGIKWDDTKKLVEDVFEGWEGNWYVLAPPGST